MKRISFFLTHFPRIIIPPSPRRSFTVYRTPLSLSFYFSHFCFAFIFPPPSLVFSFVIYSLFFFSPLISRSLSSLFPIERPTRITVFRFQFSGFLIPGRVFLFSSDVLGSRPCRRVCPNVAATPVNMRLML